VTLPPSGRDRCPRFSDEGCPTGRSDAPAPAGPPPGRLACFVHEALAPGTAGASRASTRARRRAGIRGPPPGGPRRRAPGRRFPPTRRSRTNQLQAGIPLRARSPPPWQPCPGCVPARYQVGSGRFDLAGTGLSPDRRRRSLSTTLARARRSVPAFRLTGGALRRQEDDRLARTGSRGTAVSRARVDRSTWLIRQRRRQHSTAAWAAAPHHTACGLAHGHVVPPKVSQAEAERSAGSTRRADRGTRRAAAKTVTRSQAQEKGKLTAAASCQHSAERYRRGQNGHVAAAPGKKRGQHATKSS